MEHIKGYNIKEIFNSSREANKHVVKYCATKNRWIAVVDGRLVHIDRSNALLGVGGRVMWLAK